jgi:NifU-like protein involved in Fe-S cluster formation
VGGRSAKDRGASGKIIGRIWSDLFYNGMEKKVSNFFSMLEKKSNRFLNGRSLVNVILNFTGVSLLMPCSDSSSSISLLLDHDEKLVSFDFAKITCGREITAETGYEKYCQGRTLQEILAIPYSQVCQELNTSQEEAQFILYLEWDALRAAIVQYLGASSEDVDGDRCRITSIEYDEEGIEIGLVILPPKELPKIIACGIADRLPKE